MVQPMLSVCQSGLKVSVTLKNMQTDGVKMENQRFASGCAARPWLMSIPWVHPAPPPWRGRAFLSQELQQIVPEKVVIC